MSERVNGRDSGIHFRRKAYIPERPGILTSPSEDLLRRRAQAERDRANRLATILQTQALKAVAYTESAILDTQDGVEPSVLVETERPVWEELPIAAHREFIVDTINNNKASIIISETGSGKSTQVPQYLLDAGYKHVYVIQGRRPMVDGLSDRIQYELDSRLGTDTATGLVSSIHGGRTRRYDNSQITALTAATLTKMMPSIVEKHGDDMIAFLPDEVHEDDQHVELATGVVGIEVSRHDNWRVVPMSATIDPEPLKVPLGRITNFENPAAVDVPVIRIEGRPHPLELVESPDLNVAETFLEVGQNDRITMLGERGFEQIKRMREAIVEGYEAREAGSSSRLLFREFTGKTSSYQREELAKLAADLPEELQLVILATPAARSGITIPGLTRVIIGGLINREKRKDDRSRGIVPDYMSRAEVIQFLSRAGRDVDGGMGHLAKPMSGRKKPEDRSEFEKVYPFKSMDERPEYPQPAIFNSNLSELILNAASANHDPDLVNKFIMNEQDKSTLDVAVRRLRNEFGALDNDNKITEIGRLMSRFPVAPELSRGLAEAMRNGRSRHQLARMAVIATAIDAGGFQGPKNADHAEWRRLVVPGLDDDFTAQLGILHAMHQMGFKGGPSRDGATYAYLNDLDYSNILNAEEPTAKIMRRMGIDVDNFEVELPNSEEMKDIRDDFTAGMYGLTYREFHRRNDPGHYFKSIQHPDRYPERALAKQSILSPANGELIAGMPQFYMTITKGKETQVDILGSTLRVSPDVVGRYALAGRLVDYVDVPGTSRMDGGIVTESEQAMFGTLKVGSHKPVKGNLEIPLESQRKLVENVQKKPGYELGSLQELAKDLAELRRLMPGAMLAAYRRPNAPVDITHTTIEQKLKQYAVRTRSAQEIDQLIGKYIESEGISMELYYQSNAREEIHRRSPESIMVAGEPLRIFYANGKPYVTHIKPEQLAAIDGPLFIDEGFDERREVLRQIPKEGGRGTHRVSFSRQVD